MRVVPISLRQASAFIARHHRHHKPPRGMRFAVGVIDHAGSLVAVATAGRPVSRVFDPMQVLEINRTCTNGTRHANSMLYGACRRAAKAMGFERVVTYTQEDESGASLRGAGFRVDERLAARGSWAESSVALTKIRDPIGTGGVPRIRWVWP
jgi:hypothetical protein